jgi:hypothetical protein
VRVVNKISAVPAGLPPLDPPQSPQLVVSIVQLEVHVNVPLAQL